jgi:hypothetical protein
MESRLHGNMEPVVLGSLLLPFGSFGYSPSKHGKVFENGSKMRSRVKIELLNP